VQIFEDEDTDDEEDHEAEGEQGINEEESEEVLKAAVLFEDSIGQVLDKAISLSIHMAEAAEGVEVEEGEEVDVDGNEGRVTASSSKQLGLEDDMLIFATTHSRLPTTPSGLVDVDATGVSAGYSAGDAQQERSFLTRLAARSGEIYATAPTVTEAVLRRSGGT
jgi:hypothetical protein